MATDLSRVRHDPLLDWAGVQLKQGGVLLDADANELVAVLDRRLRALASDVLGRATVSQTTPDAFRVTDAGGDLEIGRGRLYVDGLLAESHGDGGPEFDPLMAEPRFDGPLRYTTQPYLPSPPALPTSGRHLVYLDVWNREVTPLEHPGLIDDAVGIDTGSRVQTAWQVRVLDEEAGTGATCATPDGELPGWTGETAPSEGRLSTGTFDVPPLDDPCELPPTGGYRGLENQLYRIEIHDGGMPGTATFKWSRENASVGSRVASYISPTELELETLGRDDVLGFAPGDWVEIIDDNREFDRSPGEMRRIDIPDPGNRRILFAPALPADMLPAAFPDGSLPGQRNLRVRRWDQRGQVFRTELDGSTTELQNLDLPASTGLITVPAAGVELLLENGVTASFDSTGQNGFRSGDWWTFAARTSDASVEILDNAPPRGIHHHYARLGIWDVDAGTVTDCRHLWPPEGGDHDCGCTQCVSPESHASGQLTIQDAVDRVRDTGGTVCLQPGTYPLGEPVRIAGARSVTIRGQGPATILTAPGAAFTVETSMAVCIERLSVLTVGQRPAIEARNAMGLGLRELLLYVFDGISDFRNAAISLSGICAGVVIHDNLLVAPDGIRTDTDSDQEGPAFALLGAVAIERNLFSCGRRGIMLSGTVGHLWETRIAGNQFANCSSHGILTDGIALPGGSLRIEDNNLNVQGHGIVCGVGGTWIDSNRLHCTGEGDSDGIALVGALQRAGTDRIHVLANQVDGFAGDGIAIRMPVRDLIVKLNIVTDCGNGIVMSEEAESDSASIENNHVRGIVGGSPNGRVGMVAGISVAYTAAATIAGNQVGEVAIAVQGRARSAGVMLEGVSRSRVDGNDISRIGPVDDSGGGSIGIFVSGPLMQTEISGNSVRRDDEPEPGATPWYALAVVDTVVQPGTGAANSFGYAAAYTVAVDARRSVVFDNGRARIVTHALDFVAPTAVARGSVATISGNLLSARGAASVVYVLTSAEIMFNNNRCELLGGANMPGGVMLASPVLVLNANRARSSGRPTIHANAQVMTALGNITNNGIEPLPAPWNELNANG